MAFSRPTLATLASRIAADLSSRLELEGALLRRSFVTVLARVIAGAAHMLHGHLEWLSRQIFPDQSEAEFLVRQAGLYGVTRTAPTYAAGQVRFTGVNTTVIPAGTVLRRSDGVEYTTNTDCTISGGIAIEMITAVVPGSYGNLIEGMILSFETPISGANAAVTVDPDPADGNDEETIEALRVRLLERMAEPAHGGTLADYVAWAKEVAGVTRAWPVANGLGPGTVLVRFVRDGDASPIPDVGEVAQVQSYLASKAPAHATVTAFAPSLAPINVTLSVVPNTVAVQNAVAAQLVDYLTRNAEPGKTILRSGLTTAIGTSPGVTDFSLVSPAANVTNGANELASLGSVGFL
jgi:uncharacterized phage protein gp47/JayE